MKSESEGGRRLAGPLQIPLSKKLPGNCRLRGLFDRGWCVELQPMRLADVSLLGAISGFRFEDGLHMPRRFRHEANLIATHDDSIGSHKLENRGNGFSQAHVGNMELDVGLAPFDDRAFVRHRTDFHQHMALLFAQVVRRHRHNRADLNG